MSEAVWRAVDEYIISTLHVPDKELDAARLASEQAGLPDIAVAANQGKLLNLLARGQGARQILELGSLGGYSTSPPPRDFGVVASGGHSADCGCRG